MKVILGERRREPRIRMDGVRGLTIVSPSWPPRVLTAKVVDVAKSGLGVEAKVPLVVGSYVLLTCKIRGGEFCMQLHGQAAVTFCQREDSGLFRIGISMENYRWRSFPPRSESPS